MCVCKEFSGHVQQDCLAADCSPPRAHAAGPRRRSRGGALGGLPGRDSHAQRVAHTAGCGGGRTGRWALGGNTPTPGAPPIRVTRGSISSAYTNSKVQTSRRTFRRPACSGGPSALACTAACGAGDAMAKAKKAFVTPERIRWVQLWCRLLQVRGALGSAPAWHTRRPALPGRPRRVVDGASGADNHHQRPRRPAGAVPVLPDGRERARAQRRRV